MFKTAKQAIKAIASPVLGQVAKIDATKKNSTWWNGPGGEKHAESHVNRDDWMTYYGAFYREALATITPGSRVIELGCSAGYWYERLEMRSKGISYTGTDFSEAAIEAAKIRLPEMCTLFHADLADGVDLEGFDHILICNVLFFLPVEIVRAIFSAVPPGATITISEPVATGVERQKSSIFFKPAKHGTVAWHHAYPALLSECGLAVVRSSSDVPKPGALKYISTAIKAPISS